MRYLAIGDIHGCFTALQTLERSVPFAADDVIITLGDYVNRGPNSFAVIDWLIHREEQGTLRALRGNHEVMMLEARNGSDAFARWMEVGGDATLASYSPLGDAGRLGDIPDAHWEFLESKTRRWFETDSHFFVHASAYPDIPLDEQPDYMLFWERFDNPPPHESAKIMVCGHTSQRSGLPAVLPHAWCIDTWACGDGWLTCVDVRTRRFWQANERAQTRTGWLDELES